MNNIMPAQDSVVIRYQPTEPRVTTYTFANYTAETTSIQTPFILSVTKQTSNCMIVLFLPPDGITYHCEDLTDIDDIIAKYTTTEAGKTAFQLAEQELHGELRQEVLAGKLNKVKYYRLTSSMDQKTLSDRTGIKQSNLSRIERLGYEADVETYKKIAEVFNIDYKELLP